MELFLSLYLTLMTWLGSSPVSLPQTLEPAAQAAVVESSDLESTDPSVAEDPSLAQSSGDSCCTTERHPGIDPSG